MNEFKQAEGYILSETGQLLERSGGLEYQPNPML
jgi:hypothetical protein